MSHLAGMAGGCEPSLLAVWTLHVLGLRVRERQGVHVELRRGAIGWTDDGTLQSD